MKQPELGKKIAELRKAKGLTQEELVEKCNINVRTLQRIEAGEATPRSYTVKIIFAALDYNIYDSSKRITNRFINIGLFISKWLEQFYKYVIDLFNLKTNAMRKIMILSVPFLTICTVLLISINSNVRAQAKMAIREKFKETISQYKFVQWFNTGQIDSISMLYLDSACMMPDNFPTIYGRENIKGYYRQLYNTGIRFKTAKFTSIVISDSIAVERGVWNIELVNIELVNVTGTYLSQWRYINGSWRVENEMTKSDKTIIPEESK